MLSHLICGSFVQTTGRKVADLQSVMNSATIFTVCTVCNEYTRGKGGCSHFFPFYIEDDLISITPIFPVIFIMTIHHSIIIDEIIFQSRPKVPGNTSEGSREVCCLSCC